MENNKKLRVAITHGDTNGIGYELIFKTFAVRLLYMARQRWLHIIATH